MPQVSFNLQYRLGDFVKMARQLRAASDQIPFVLSTTMNAAVTKVRRHLIERTWPHGVTVRNKSFLGAALRTKFANKHDLQVQIFDRLGRANLYLHAIGGTRRPRAGGTIAVPSRAIRKGSRGVPARQRPRALKDAVRKGNFIFQRQGRQRRLRLMYTLIKVARIRKAVPFYEDFDREFRNAMASAMPAAVMKAMSTRK